MAPPIFIRLSVCLSVCPAIKAYISATMSWILWNLVSYFWFLHSPRSFHNTNARTTQSSFHNARATLACDAACWVNTCNMRSIPDGKKKNPVVVRDFPLLQNYVPFKKIRNDVIMTSSLNRLFPWHFDTIVIAPKFKLFRPASFIKSNRYRCSFDALPTEQLLLGLKERFFFCPF